VCSFLESIPSMHMIKITDVDASDDNNWSFALLPFADGDRRVIKSPPQILTNPSLGPSTNLVQLGRNRAFKWALHARACRTVTSHEFVLPMATCHINVANVSQYWIEFPLEAVINAKPPFLLPPLFLPTVASVSVVSVSPPPQ
jgi:hypothetical protein